MAGYRFVSLWFTLSLLWCISTQRIGHCVRHLRKWWPLSFGCGVKREDSVLTHPLLCLKGPRSSPERYHFSVTNLLFFFKIFSINVWNLADNFWVNLSAVEDDYIDDGGRRTARNYSWKRFQISCLFIFNGCISLSVSSCWNWHHPKRMMDLLVDRWSGKLGGWSLSLNATKKFWIRIAAQASLWNVCL